jgi:hypothetical protein
MSHVSIIDPHIIIMSFDKRSVMQIAVPSLPNFLPLLSLQQHQFTEGFLFLKILFELFLADVDGELVQDLDHIVYCQLSS